MMKDPLGILYLFLIVLFSFIVLSIVILRIIILFHFIHKFW